MKTRMWKAVVVAVLIAAWDNPAATAGAVQYEWTPIGGGGFYSTQTSGTIYYQSYDGYLLIDYDPDNIRKDSVTVFVGSPVNQSFGAR